MGARKLQLVDTKGDGVVPSGPVPSKETTMSTEVTDREETARERALRTLREHPEGLSKNQLREAVGGNSGAFRRLVQSMEDRGEIVVFEEERPNCGLTKVHRAAAAA